MITKEHILPFLKDQKALFAKEFHVVKLGLFGSYARDEQSEESDIDVLIEFAPKTERLSEKKAKIRSIIQKKFHKKVDLCREKYIKPYFKTQIIQSAIYV